jgi:hypothetical protein
LVLLALSYNEPIPRLPLTTTKLQHPITPPIWVEFKLG